jgi:hypothetical protein
MLPQLTSVLVVLSVGACFAQFDIGATRVRYAIPEAGNDPDPLLTRCKYAIVQKQSAYNSLTNRVEKAGLVAVFLGVATGVIASISGGQTPGEGLTDPQAVRDEAGGYSGLEITAIAVAGATALDTGLTTYWGSLSAKRATDVKDLIELVNDMTPIPATGSNTTPTPNPRRPSDAVIEAKCPPIPGR